MHVESGVIENRMSPIYRAVQFEELVWRPPHVVIYRLENEIVEVQGKSSLDERIVIKSNENYGFFALPEPLNTIDQRGVIADPSTMINHVILLPTDNLINIHTDIC